MQRKRSKPNLQRMEVVAIDSVDSENEFAAAVSAATQSSDKEFSDLVKAHAQYLAEIRRQLQKLDFLYESAAKRHPMDENRPFNPRLALRIAMDRAVLNEKRWN